MAVNQKFLDRLKSQLTPESIRELKERHGLTNRVAWAAAFKVSPKRGNYNRALVCDAVQMLEKQRREMSAVERESEMIINE